MAEILAVITAVPQSPNIQISSYCQTILIASFQHFYISMYTKRIFVYIYIYFIFAQSQCYGLYKILYIHAGKYLQPSLYAILLYNFSHNFHLVCMYALQNFTTTIHNTTHIHIHRKFTVYRYFILCWQQQYNIYFQKRGAFGGIILYYISVYIADDNSISILWSQTLFCACHASFLFIISILYIGMYLYIGYRFICCMYVNLVYVYLYECLIIPMYMKTVKALNHINTSAHV